MRLGLFRGEFDSNLELMQTPTPNISQEVDSEFDSNLELVQVSDL